jgi:hypothetical protein
VPSDPVALARAVVTSFELYAAAGLLFAPWFVWRGVGRLDPHAREATWGFRLVIVPGVVAFWPLLAWRLLAGRPAPPDERNAHRVTARRLASDRSQP